MEPRFQPDPTSNTGIKAWERRVRPDFAGNTGARLSERRFQRRPQRQGSPTRAKSRATRRSQSLLHACTSEVPLIARSNNEWECRM